MQPREDVVRRLADAAADGIDLLMHTIHIAARATGATGQEYATAMHIAVTDALLKVLLMAKDPEQFADLFIETTREGLLNALKQHLKDKNDTVNAKEFNVEELLKNIKPKENGA